MELKQSLLLQGWKKSNIMAGNKKDVKSTVNWYRKKSNNMPLEAPVIFSPSGGVSAMGTPN